MKAFEYVSAGSPASARELAANGGRYLAGGIDLLGEMKEYIVEPSTVVNIKGLPGLRKVSTGKSAWTIGALATVAELEDHDELKKIFPGLAQAAAEVGSRQIRNMATVGGNLAQHSRCWYYRHRDIRCLKKGGASCHARDGENKYHSLFTGTTCISPSISNLAVALAALNARVSVQRGDNVLDWSIADLYAKAWENSTAHNSLEPGDLILEIKVPVEGTRSAYLQVSERAAFDWALVSCGAAAKVDGKRLENARLVLGSIANVPYQVAAANQILEGQVLDEALANHAADVLLKDAQIRSENGYKIPIARALVRRTLMQLIA